MQLVLIHARCDHKNVFVLFICIWKHYFLMWWALWVGLMDFESLLSQFAVQLSRDHYIVGWISWGRLCCEGWSACMFALRALAFVISWSFVTLKLTVYPEDRLSFPFCKLVSAGECWLKENGTCWGSGCSDGRCDGHSASFFHTQDWGRTFSCVLQVSVRKSHWTYEQALCCSC